MLMYLSAHNNTAVLFVKALDPNMNRHTAIAEWLSYSDEVNSFMPRARDGFQLMPYVSAVAAAVYSLCAVGANRRPKVEWPRKYVLLLCFKRCGAMLWCVLHAEWV